MTNGIKQAQVEGDDRKIGQDALSPMMEKIAGMEASLADIKNELN